MGNEPEFRYHVHGEKRSRYLNDDKTLYYDECGDYATEAEACEAARAFLAGKRNEVHSYGRSNPNIGSVTYWFAEAERQVNDEDWGWMACDAEGRTGDDGFVPNEAWVFSEDTFGGSVEERAFELAKGSYYDFLDFKDDCYDTVADALELLLACERRKKGTAADVAKESDDGAEGLTMDGDKKGPNAGDAGFTEADCTCDEAVFVLRCDGEPIKLFEAHLCDDEESPSGLAFDFTAYGFNEAGDLAELGGGRYWGFSGADQLISECPVGHAEAVRAEAAQLDALMSEGTSEAKVMAALSCVDMLPDATLDDCPMAFREEYRKLCAEPAHLAKSARKAAVASATGDGADERHETIGGK